MEFAALVCDLCAFSGTHCFPIAPLWTLSIPLFMIGTLNIVLCSTPVGHEILQHLSQLSLAINANNRPSSDEGGSRVSHPPEKILKFYIQNGAF
mgnify:CR=1 FL=1